MAAPEHPLRRAHLTPYTSVQAGDARSRPTSRPIEDARVAAERDFGVRLRWIYDIPGEFGLPAAEDTLRLRPATTRPRRLIGFGLGGPEVGVDRPQFKDVLRRSPRRRAAQRAARGRDHRPADGLGRAARPRGRAHRARHLRRCRTPSCVAHLVEHRIPLEVCPTSNIATRAVDVLENHPIRQMYDAGVLVTVNSDDPPMFGTTLNREYEIAADLLDLDERGIAGSPRTPCRPRSCPDADKAALAAEIDAYAAAGSPSRSRA